MKKALFAFFALLFVTASFSLTTNPGQARPKTNSLCCDVTVSISGAAHLEEVFATLSIGGYPVSDRVSSQTLREFDFHVNPDYSADFTVWGSNCRTCKIKRHFALGKDVPKTLHIQLRTGR